MKNEEIDIDFIGGETPLTTIEEKALRDYFKQQKASKLLESQTVKSLVDKNRLTKKKRLPSKSV